MPILCERSAYGVRSHLWRERCRRLVRKLLEEEVADGENEHSLPQGEGTGERVCPITTGARCTPTHDMSVSGSLELRRLQDQVHLMRLPQQPQRESGQFSWDSRSDLCGDAVDFHGTPAPAAAGIRSF